MAEYTIKDTIKRVYRYSVVPIDNNESTTETKYMTESSKTGTIVLTSSRFAFCKGVLC